MKHKKIVFVCTGNTCRSPMAEAALRAELKRRKIRWYTVRSAGLHARAGEGMNPLAKQALTEAGIAYSESFAARLLTPAMIRDAFIVICMTEQQCASIDYVNVASMEELGGREIPDPYGMGIDAYRAALRNIRECLPHIISSLRLGENPTE